MCRFWTQHGEWGIRQYHRQLARPCTQSRQSKTNAFYWHSCWAERGQSWAQIQHPLVSASSLKHFFSLRVLGEVQLVAFRLKQWLYSTCNTVMYDRHFRFLDHVATASQSEECLQHMDFQLMQAGHLYHRAHPWRRRSCCCIPTACSCLFYQLAWNIMFLATLQVNALMRFFVTCTDVSWRYSCWSLTALLHIENPISIHTNPLVN